jgi:hypothetical protein
MSGGAKRHSLEPWAYHREVLLDLSAGETGLEPLLPDRSGANHVEHARSIRPRKASWGLGLLLPCPGRLRRRGRLRAVNELRQYFRKGTQPRPRLRRRGYALGRNRPPTGVAATIEWGDIARLRGNGASRLSRLNERAYAGTVFDLTGAAASHYAVGDDATKLVALIFTGLAVASWALHPSTRRLDEPSS